MEEFDTNSFQNRFASSNTSIKTSFNINDESNYSSHNQSIFSSNIEKARSEQFFLLWSIIWISFVFYIVYTQWSELFTPYHYLTLGLILFLVLTFVPLLFPSLFQSTHILITRRYTTKANVYIGIFSWIANYFWTHYFYSVLHATYTFQAHRLNNVPFALYMMTHSYFHLYHVLSSIISRWIWRCLANQGRIRYLYVGIIAIVGSCIVAFLETFTIQHFPYYHIPDRYATYVYGSMFYAIYFIVSFPMFAPIDERANTWNLWEIFIQSMAACMIVTQLLDFWRLFIGPIIDIQSSNSDKKSVPFIY